MINEKEEQTKCPLAVMMVRKGTILEMITYLIRSKHILTGVCICLVVAHRRSAEPLGWENRDVYCM